MTDLDELITKLMQVHEDDPQRFFHYLRVELELLTGMMGSSKNNWHERAEREAEQFDRDTPNSEYLRTGVFALLGIGQRLTALNAGVQKVAARLVEVYLHTEKVHKNLGPLVKELERIGNLVGYSR
jgi:uncharacterized alpha-E superfamily protein